jgi:hypothetical protein
MRVKIQIDSDSGFACVRRQSDHAQVGELEELRKQKPMFLDVTEDEYVMVTEESPPEPEEQVRGRFSEFSEDEE